MPTTTFHPNTQVGRTAKQWTKCSCWIWGLKYLADEWWMFFFWWTNHSRRDQSQEILKIGPWWAIVWVKNVSWHSWKVEDVHNRCSDPRNDSDSILARWLQIWDLFSLEKPPFVASHRSKWAAIHGRPPSWCTSLWNMRDATILLWRWHSESPPAFWVAQKKWFWPVILKQTT